MRTFLIFFFACICLENSYAQQKNISIAFNNTTIVEAMQQIESKTNYQFYYLEQWLQKNKRYTQQFNNVTLKVVLDYLFTQQTTNYYILDDATIILTNNSKIHESALTVSSPNDKTQKTKKSTAAPILISKQEARGNITTRVVRIGKETTGQRASTYTLTGYVKDFSSAKPVSNLVLLVRDKNIYATTNEKGFYTIQLPYGVNTVEAILSGYQKEKIKFVMYGNGNHNFKVLEISNQLDEVVIETNAKVNIKSAVTGIVHIKAEDIKVIPQVLGERDIIKIATTLPGINNAGEGDGGINVRGGKADQNLFLLDKSTLYNPTHFLGLFSAVNPFVTKDIKIYKGDIPSKYGGRISSVFDIISKDSKVDNEKITGEASVGPVTSNLSVDLPIIKGKSGLLLAGRSTYSNWILRELDNRAIQNSSASFYDVYAKYTHKFNDNNDLKASAYYSSDTYSIASDTTNAYSNRIVSLDWHHKFNEKHSGNLLASHSGYAFSIDYDGDHNNNFKIKYNINEFRLGLNMKYALSNKHKISYGASSKLYNIAPGEINPKGANSIISPLKVQDEKALENSIYIEDSFTLNDKLAFNFGARYSLFTALGPSTQRIYAPGSPKSDATVTGERTYGNNEAIKTHKGLSFRFSTRYSLTDDLSLKASVNNSFQFIHTLTNNTTASPTDIWKLSDAHIKPQEALQGVLGIYKNIDGNAYEISLEGYYKRFKNILDYKVGADLLLNQFVETQALQGPGKSYGVEFLLRKNKGRFNGWLSYTYSRSFLKLDGQFLEERVNNGQFFPTNFDKPHDLSLIMNYRITKRFSLSSNFVYQTGRPITYPIGKYVSNGAEFLLYSNRNQFRVPDYFRFDIGFNVEGNHKLNKIGHSFWNISIYNLFGRNNPYSIFFVTENGKVQAYQSSIFSTPIPTITYNFKF